jgi:hypothetical protein
MSRLALWWILFRMMLAEKPAIKKPRLTKIYIDLNDDRSRINYRVRFYDLRG